MKIFLFFIFLILSRIGFSQGQNIHYSVHFNSGKNVVNSSDKRWLDSVSTILQSASGYTVEIKGYCDADGSDESNILLSKARSEKVKEIFINNKLDSKFIKANSFGEHAPIAENSSEEGKAKNRRAEIVIDFEKNDENSKEDTFENKTEKNTDLNDLASGNLEVGKKLILKNLNFEGGTAVLLIESEPTLKALLQLMKDNATLEIEIGGHVCCGPDMPLSIARAKKVYTYLAGYGINEKRMAYKGYSYDKPIASDKTAEGRTLNRRVEITILKL